MNQTDSKQGVAPSARYARYYDTATDIIACLIRILTGQYSVVFLATPPAVTEQYLEVFVRCLRRRCVVVAEKPWAASLAGAIRLEALLGESGVRLRCNDHYLAKPVVLWLLQQPLAFLLGGPIISVKARLLETPGHLSPAMAATGVLRDLLIHLVTVVHRIFPGERIDITSGFAARHDGWPGQSAQGEPTESCASLVGVIDTGRSRVSVDLGAAKDCPAAEKVLRIEGPEGTLWIDFAQDRAELEFPNGSRRLLFPVSATKAEKPYSYVFRRLSEGDASVGLDINEAVAVLRVLHEAQQLFPNPLPIYQKKTCPPGV
jgi:predicted dehydrogenase